MAVVTGRTGVLFIVSLSNCLFRRPTGETPIVPIVTGWNRLRYGKHSYGGQKPVTRREVRCPQVRWLPRDNGR